VIVGFDVEVPHIHHVLVHVHRVLVLLSAQTPPEGLIPDGVVLVERGKVRTALFLDAHIHLHALLAVGVDHVTRVVVHELLLLHDIPDTDPQVVYDKLRPAGIIQPAGWIVQSYLRDNVRVAASRVVAHTIQRKLADTNIPHAGHLHRAAIRVTNELHTKYMVVFHAPHMVVFHVNHMVALRVITHPMKTTCQL